MINNVLEGLKRFIREHGKGIGLAISAIVVLIVLAYSMQIFTLSFYTPLQLYNNFRNHDSISLRFPCDEEVEINLKSIFKGNLDKKIFNTYFTLSIRDNQLY